MTGAVLPLAAILFGIHPLGGEFRVNTYTTATQDSPAVAARIDGGFVVVWRGVDPSDDSTGIFGERFSAAGQPIGGPFHVNTYTTALQSRPRVASDATGLFVVTWSSYKEDGINNGVFARLYGAGGAPFTAPFRVNTLTTGSQSEPAVAMDAAGQFVVAYYGRDGASGSYSIFARRYLANGTTLSEVRVNATGSARSMGPAVSYDSSGAFVVAFNRTTSVDSNSDVYVRPFTRDGAPLGVDFLVNEETVGYQGHAGISAGPGGGFVVAWTLDSSEGHRARLYGANGHSITSDILVSSSTSIGDPPGVLALPDGGFVVVFDAYAASPSQYSEILLRRYSSAGALVGSELRVNTYTTGRQFHPSIAGHPGGFVVVWAGDGDGGGYGVFGQRFATTPLGGDANGDGVAGIEDVFYLINFLFASGPAPVG